MACSVTPLKTIMDPDNHWFVEENRHSRCQSQGACLFLGVLNHAKSIRRNLNCELVKYGSPSCGLKHQSAGIFFSRAHVRHVGMVWAEDLRCVHRSCKTYRFTASSGSHIKCLDMGENLPHVVYKRSLFSRAPDQTVKLVRKRSKTKNVTRLLQVLGPLRDDIAIDQEAKRAPIQTRTQVLQPNRLLQGGGLDSNGQHRVNNHGFVNPCDNSRLFYLTMQKLEGPPLHSPSSPPKPLGCSTKPAQSPPHPWRFESL